PRPYDGAKSRVDHRSRTASPRPLLLRANQQRPSYPHFVWSRCGFFLQMRARDLIRTREHKRTVGPLTRTRSATAREGECDLQWMCFHTVKRGATPARGSLHRMVRPFLALTSSGDRRRG